MTTRVRLAPSPTGSLHIGTARTALFNWLYAKRNGGRFLLRIEDTDRTRSKQEYVENILEGLKWLGLSWDEDPVIQSTQINSHKEAIKILLEKGLAYRCYVTEEELNKMREDQIQEGQAPKYDNRHRSLKPEDEEKFIQEGRTSVIRFRIDNECTIQWNDLIRGVINWSGNDLGGDMVIARRTNSKEIGDPLYNLAVVVDDSRMNITHVIRGEDHIANTAKQILIYKALNLPIPKFAHSPLILNQEGKKLSKRDGVTSISDFKLMGYTPQALANYMTLLGWSPPEEMDERFTLNEVSKVFGFNRVNKAGAKFDWEKLNWLNAQIIHDLSPEKLLEELKPLWIKQGWEISSNQWALKLTELLGPSLTLINDGIEEARPFFEDPSITEDGINHLKVDGAKQSLNILLEKLENKPWDGLDTQFAKELLNSVAKSANIKKGILMKSLRVALIGKVQGPDLLTTWSLVSTLGKDISRIQRVL